MAPHHARLSGTASLVLAATVFSHPASAQADCSGFGVTWGPGIGPPPAGCGRGNPGSQVGGGTLMGGGGGGPARGSTGSSSPHAAPLLGTVGLTTASGADVNDGTVFSPGEDIYGPFEAGFSSAQDFILEGLGCADPARGHVAGGLDTQTAEAMIRFGCGIELPRFENGRYIGLIDQCGGHTREYHFHERLECLYDTTARGHSAKVGTGNNQDLFGKFESTGELPELDACGGHYGVTPESNGEVVYHYHVQDAAPFTFGCYGPNDDGTLVTVAQCRDFYPGCGDGDEVEIETTDGKREYDLWCPCYDANGSNLGEIAELAIFQGHGGAPPASAPADTAAMTTSKETTKQTTTKQTTTAQTTTTSKGVSTTTTSKGVSTTTTSKKATTTSKKATTTSKKVTSTKSATTTAAPTSGSTDAPQTFESTTAAQRESIDTTDFSEAGSQQSNGPLARDQNGGVSAGGRQRPGSNSPRPTTPASSPSTSSPTEFGNEPTEQIAATDRGTSRADESERIAITPGAGAGKQLAVAPEGRANSDGRGPSSAAGSEVNDSDSTETASDSEGVSATIITIVVIVAVLVIVAVVAGAKAYRRANHAAAVPAASGSGSPERRASTDAEFNGTTAQLKVQRELMCPVYEQIDVATQSASNHAAGAYQTGYQTATLTGLSGTRTSFS